ncbi:MAG TPA: J domain-containing protein, partial [Candidatus Limnocylindrales bacterium]
SDFFRAFFSGDQPAEGGVRETRGTGGGRVRGRAGGASFEDILAGMEVDEAMASAPSPSARRASPLEVSVDLSLEEAYHGTSRLVEIDGKRLEVTVPRGVDNGSRIRLRGKGPDGRDIHLVTKIRPHPVFSREGANLTREVPITLKEALLGAEVPITTLKGRILLTIPTGTQNGRTFRLGGQGMPRLDKSGTGDLLVKARVVLPTKLTAEAATEARRLFDLIDQPDPRSVA